MISYSISPKQVTLFQMVREDFTERVKIEKELTSIQHKVDKYVMQLYGVGE